MFFGDKLGNVVWDHLRRGKTGLTKPFLGLHQCFLETKVLENSVGPFAQRQNGFNEALVRIAPMFFGDKLLEICVGSFLQ